MKGVVFTELLDFVADKYGADTVDDVIDEAALPHDGAYTGVGTYPFVEMQRLLAALSRQSGIAIPDLLTTFGHHLCNRFIVKFPDFFHTPSNLFDLIESVDRYIHVEVYKLYPDAELPTFSMQARNEERIVIDYRSCRALESLAEGMIKAAASHYGERVTVDRMRVTLDQDSAVRFTVRRAA